jgi:tRNA dimethylallyltransferase
VLYERADRRVAAMMAAGFLDEVRALRARGYGADLPALSSLGYAELGRYLDGVTSLDAAVEATRFATHRFIRRQLTWFRREPELHWIDITDDDPAEQATEAALRWLELPAGAGERAGA